MYFLWICPSHKHFEWFIDVLRDVEKKDVTNVLEIHIFITQFFHKFDLRTTMLVRYYITSFTILYLTRNSWSLQYICENHFQRLSKTSIFTGLKAVNHFGRPDMTSFLKFVQKRHSYVRDCFTFSWHRNSNWISNILIYFGNIFCRWVKLESSAAALDLSQRAWCRLAMMSIKGANCPILFITLKTLVDPSVVSKNI